MELNNEGKCHKTTFSHKALGRKKSFRRRVAGGNLDMGDILYIYNIKELKVVEE